jgi:hypothetical protein
VANNCERAVAQSCNPACLHVLLVFNGSSTARLAGAQHRPYHVVLWKIRARPDGDHDGRIAKGYLFILIARGPLSLLMGHVVAPELP